MRDRLGERCRRTIERFQRGTVSTVGEQVDAGNCRIDALGLDRSGQGSIQLTDRQCGGEFGDLWRGLLTENVRRLPPPK